MNLFDLSGKVAVVTGGNGGLGLAMARGLVKAGADVAIWGRNADKNRAACEELGALGGGQAAAFSCDVLEDSQIAAALAATLDRFGKVDVCFANAGVGGGRALPEMTPQAWDDVMAINARGVALTYRHVTAHMIERGEGGKLLATSSGQSIMGVNRSSNYAASKAAVNGLTRGAAFELARHGITANAFLFGFYETDMTESADPRFAEWMTKRIPLRRFGDHEGLEGLAVFFASPHSDYITGQCLPIDGGLSIS
ncbi:SDR family oxidoreductase [Altererythrobacter arenosus]|uniref:SDR family oxidoreductase n=1 Tax=Altererythrobacter arenosus TaxID=3032592 RepID=A0ABY8FSJ7_9SPHN|nr:SDR family oxidoreductase [Altererythrobacter sp. CAU 1644]WFL76863.1 SDR family oxidoreductase [Altererythrobacter sp. CAU 1644]